MLTLFGEDRPGIVAAVTQALFQSGCNLGETSMARIGGGFTILMMVQPGSRGPDLEAVLEPVVSSLGLHLHIDPMPGGGLHRHLQPEVRISVHGADRAGIVAQVTTALAEAGFTITDLASDVAGSEESPIYILHIEGCATRGTEAVRAALDTLLEGEIRIHVTEIDTLIG